MLASLPSLQSMLRMEEADNQGQNGREEVWEEIGPSGLAKFRRGRRTE